VFGGLQGPVGPLDTAQAERKNQRCTKRPAAQMPTLEHLEPLVDPRCASIAEQWQLERRGPEQRTSTKRAANEQQTSSKRAPAEQQSPDAVK
jgi:hypothetical protein